MTQDRGKPLCCRWVEEKLNEFHATPWGHHFKNARKEVLLGVRAILDRRIEAVDRLGEVREPQKIEVE